jgi:hypothetical protein
MQCIQPVPASPPCQGSLRCEARAGPPGASCDRPRARATPSGFLGQKYFGVTTIYKEGTPSVHRGWRRPPPGGRASPTAWGLQQLVMENHSAIRGLKISHRGACALPVDCVARVQEGRGRPCPRGQHVGRAVEEREFCPVNLEPNDCDPPLLLPIRRQTTSAWPAWLQLPGLSLQNLESFTKNAGPNNFNVLRFAYLICETGASKWPSLAMRGSQRRTRI